MDDEIVFDGRRRGRSAKGQFEKGCSGNPKGRPRSKHQRALSSRQDRRDILAVTEEMVTVRTSAGTSVVPFHLANLQAVRAKASQGHAPSQRYIDKLHREAILAHEQANPKLTKWLEKREDEATNRSVDGLKKWEWRDLNLFRKWSWRL